MVNPKLFADNLAALVEDLADDQVPLHDYDADQEIAATVADVGEAMAIQYRYQEAATFLVRLSTGQVFKVWTREVR